MLRSLTFILLATICFTCFSCHPKSGLPANRFVSDNLLSGKVIGIIDGDTYDLLIPGNQKIRVRMEGIDAPEKGMPFSKVSKSYLGSLCFNKIVRISITGKDSNNRYIGFTYLEDGTELSHEMIKAGLAWHFKKYYSDADLAELETEARNAKRGLWSEKDPMSPWENRKLHKSGISTKDSFNVIESQK
jgi:micrococcal nuclease